jgi:hypothetical protein
MTTTFQGFVRLTASEPITAGVPFSESELLSSRPSPLLIPKSVLLSRASMRKNFRAFGRVELFAIITSLALLGIAVLPAFASTKSRSQSAQCLNNLRLMGRAVQIWGGDHYDEPPWRTLISEGGTRPDPNFGPKPGAAWPEYSFLSNELATPRILVCPADNGVRKIARDFSEYVHTGYRANATAYSLNLHAGSEMPGAMVFGDHNHRFDYYGPIGCSMRVFEAGSIDPLFGPSAWTNNIHGSFGNIVTMDGSALETKTSEFRAALRTWTENGSVHLLKPH